MADIAALERLDMEIRLAERQAVEALAEHLRNAIRDMPSESRMALVFLRSADKLARVAEESTPSLGAEFHLRDIEREMRELGEGEDA